GAVHTLIVYGANPGYDHPQAARFMDALAKVPLSVSFADRRDETSAGVHAICPDHHFLESWGDAEPIAGYLSLVQPTIAPLFDTRAAPETLPRWLGDDIGHPAFVRSFWRDAVHPRQRAIPDFDTFWDRTLERGFVDLGGGAASEPPRVHADFWDA